MFFKDESHNPTFSVKDRASALVSAIAKENNLAPLITASTGNAAASLAGICASQKQKVVIFVPSNIPKAKLTQVSMYGSEIVPIEGTIEDTFNLSIEAANKFGWYNCNAAFNPFTIEGAKTISFEIFSQLNKNYLIEYLYLLVME